VHQHFDLFLLGVQILLSSSIEGRVRFFWNVSNQVKTNDSTNRIF
jgi:hypothetical protein